MARDVSDETAAAATGVLPADARMGAVHLTVSDLDRSVAYWQRDIGLALCEHAGASAALGAGGRDLVVLHEELGARSARGYTGLFHLALLVPDRADLACWLAHAARDRVSLTGASDHFVSEALYLRDPDGHGIEIYADRPRPVWEGQVRERLTTLPLDTGALLAELDDSASAPFDGLPAGTVMGHVHLCASDIPETNRFYRDVVGFALMASLGREAVFLSAGGYHHHVGANIWESAGAPPAPPDTAALRHATIVLPGATARDALADRLARAGHPVEEAPDGLRTRDPSGIALVVAVAPEPLP
jgi:catechol 2,3-dioxygenase